MYAQVEFGLCDEKKCISIILDNEEQVNEFMATSKNYFLVFWARDFVSTKVLESPEYLVYCRLFKPHCWDKRSVQNPKVEFLEVPLC